MKKILVATEKPFAKIAVDQIKQVIADANYELLLLENYKTKEELISAVAQADALIIRSDIVSKDVLEAAKNLKIVIRAGAGYDNIDLVAASELKICAMNTPGQNSNAVAELAFAMMLYMARRGFNGQDGFEIKGRTIGVHAYGYIGKAVTKIAKGFDMQVYAFDPFVKEDVLKNDGVIPLGSAIELYSKCQYISVNIPLTNETKNSITFDILSRMPENAVLVNTARKEVIEENGLIQMFENRKDFQYLADIEPDCKNILLEKFKDRYLGTAKKMGANTAEANINAGVAAANQIIRFFEKGDRTFQVNK